MNEHKYTHTWIITHIHLYKPTSLYLLWCWFLDIQKSTLTVQWTATLNRAHSRPTRISGNDPQPHFHHPSPCIRIQEDIGAQTVQRWSCECQTPVKMSLTRLLFSPHPSHSTPLNVQSITIFYISPMQLCYNASWFDYFYTLNPIMGWKILTVRSTTTLASIAQLVAS